MAENDTGAMWNHIGELHKKHADLAIKVAQKGGGDEELTAAIKQLTGVVRELMEEMKSGNGRSGKPAPGDAGAAAQAP